MKILFTFQFWVFLKQLPVNSCASGELLLNDDYLLGVPNSLLRVPCTDGYFYLLFCFSPCKVLGKAAVAFDIWIDWASQLSKLSLLDCLLCFPASSPVAEKKVLINCSSCGSADKCGVWWTLFKGRSTVKGKLPHSLRMWGTKVAEMKLDVLLKCWMCIWRKQLAFYSVKRTHQMD